MFVIRRNDLSPRLEMLPLIDVIFLLLTFFIYSMILMVDAQVLPVQLTPLAQGKPPQAREIQAVTIDKDGRIFFNRDLVTLPQLDERLKVLAEHPDKPPLFLAIEQQGRVDRGPLLVQLIEHANRAGVTNIAIVGPATDKQEQ